MTERELFVPEDLVGLTIKNAWRCGEEICLFTDEGFVLLEPANICCSISYIQHVSGADALCGKIQAVEQIQDHAIDGQRRASLDEGKDCLSGWGYKIAVQGKGVCTVEMRLESNGCYQGDLSPSFIKEKPVDTKPLEDF